MKIGCLGWGSLIWNSDALPLKSGWSEDGPSAPVEFVRQSDNGLITLVLDQPSAPLPLLWAELKADTLQAARNDLRVRERTTDRNIHSWQTGDADPALIPNLAEWASARGLDAVLWTGLGPKFAGQQERRPSMDEVLTYLKGLTGQARKDAERYVRNAPRQIDTAYRRRLASVLGWSPA